MFARLGGDLKYIVFLSFPFAKKSEAYILRRVRNQMKVIVVIVFWSWKGVRSALRGACTQLRGGPADQLSFPGAESG